MIVGTIDIDRTSFRCDALGGAGKRIERTEHGLVGAFNPCAAIGMTGAAVADPLHKTAAGGTGVAHTFAFFAALSFLAGHAGAGIFFTAAISTDFIFVAGHIGADRHAVAVATKLSAGTGDPFAEIGLAGAVGRADRLVGIGAAALETTGRGAKMKQAELTGTAVAIDFAIGADPDLEALGILHLSQIDGLDRDLDHLVLQALGGSP